MTYHETHGNHEKENPKNLLQPLSITKYEPSIFVCLVCFVVKNPSFNEPSYTVLYKLAALRENYEMDILDQPLLKTELKFF